MKHEGKTSILNNRAAEKLNIQRPEDGLWRRSIETLYRAYLRAPALTAAAWGSLSLFLSIP